jgi:propanol-preferring alcohol dehydrogenase
VRAWRMTGTGEPLVRSEVPEPTTASGEAVIDVKAAGLCHSDVGALEDPGWMEIIRFVPITLGHEVAGVISEVGEGVTDHRPSDPARCRPVQGILPSLCWTNTATPLKEADLDRDHVRLAGNVPGPP